MAGTISFRAREGSSILPDPGCKDYASAQPASRPHRTGSFLVCLGLLGLGLLLLFLLGFRLLVRLFRVQFLLDRLGFGLLLIGLFFRRLGIGLLLCRLL